MNMTFWYCPKCNKQTDNWRKCQRCGTPAVLQRFVLWAVSAPEQTAPTQIKQMSDAAKTQRKEAGEK